MKSRINGQPFFMKYWINVSEFSNNELLKIIQKLAAEDVSGILAGGSLEKLKTAGEICKISGIALEHWHMMLICNDKKIIEEHEDWFMVSREGKNSALHPPYVDYYRWLCPNHPDVVAYLTGIVEEYCQIVELQAFHLDYIRYPDVILPLKCQKQYGLKQLREEPQFDFCYCPNCRQEFLFEYGYDIQRVVATTQDENWRQFRYNSISRLVRKLAGVIRSKGKQVTAAVFPTPDIARKLVRQNWPQWDLDAFYPMIYNEFYEKEIEWLQTAAEQCCKSTNKPVLAGVYLPSFDQNELARAKEILRNAGVDGICFFDFNYSYKRRCKSSKTY